MAFSLPTLGYSFDAFEPAIDARTMEIHYTKHHQTYLDKLNAAIKDTERENKLLEELLQSLDILPTNIKTAVKNNGGGHWNHNFFWKCITPGGKGMSAEFETIIKNSFGDIEEFKNQLLSAGATAFASSWVWLVKDHEDVVIKTTPNHESPLMLGEKAILVIDLWEHAYYLHYQNRRPEYLQNIWNIIDWWFVEQQYNSKY